MKLLADSTTLLALYLADDRNHRAAIDFLRATPRARFVLSEMILGEVATRLAARAGAVRGVEVARALLASQRYEVLFVDRELLNDATAFMEKHADRRLSLTDCASMALMRRIGLQSAFTFDRDFRDCGFGMVP